MAEAPIMPLATDAYLADTTHLNATEHGAYLLLIMCLWRAGGRLPNDPAKIAKFARLTPQQFKRVWPVIADFFFIEGDQIGQAKCDDMLAAVRAKSKSASESARAKWRKNKKQHHANASNPQCGNDAIQDPLSIEESAYALSEDREPKADPFTAFWAVYPNRKEKVGAKRKFAAAIKSGVDPGRIIDGARRYAQSEAVRRGYAKHPTTWLHNGCWDDEPDQPTQVPAQNGGRNERRRSAIEAAVDDARRSDERREAERGMADEDRDGSVVDLLSAGRGRGHVPPSDGALAGCLGGYSPAGFGDGDPGAHPVVVALAANSWRN